MLASNTPSNAQTLEGRLDTILSEASAIYTSDLGLTFGGISSAIIDPSGSIVTAVDGSAQGGGISMEDTLRIGAADASQLFLATLAFAMIDEGVINLDDAISTHINTGNLTNINSAITIRQLLTHTSGLADFSDSPEYFSTSFFGKPKNCL